MVVGPMSRLQRDLLKPAPCDFLYGEDYFTGRVTEGGERIWGDDDAMLADQIRRRAGIWNCWNSVCSHQIALAVHCLTQVARPAPFSPPRAKADGGRLARMWHLRH